MPGSRFKLILRRQKPPPLLLQPLSLSSYTYSSVLSEGGVIAGISGKTIGSSLSIAPNDGTVTISLDQTQLLRGAAAVTPGTDNYQLIETLPGAANSPNPTPISLTVTPASETPILQDVSVNMGQYTTPGAGTVLLKNLGLTAPGSPEVVSWRTGGVVANGGGLASNLTGLLAANTSSTTARSPTPSLGSNSALTVVTLPATSYSITVTGVGSDGSEDTCILTYVPVVDAFSIGDDNASFGRPDQFDTLRTRIGTKTGGKDWLISTGTVYSGLTFSIRAFIPTSGSTGIRYADPARPTQIRGFSFNNCQHITAVAPGIGGGAVNKVFFQVGCVDCHVQDAYPLGASIADVLPTNQGSIAAVKMSSATDCTVTGSWFEYCGRGAEFTVCTNCSVTGSIFRKNYGDGAAIGASTNTKVNRNIFIAPMRYMGSQNHIDGIQISDDITADSIEIAGNIWVEGEGNAGSIGFINGATVANSMVYKNNIVIQRAVRMMILGIQNNATVSDSTFFTSASGLIGMNSSTENDNITNSVPDMNANAASTGANTLTRIGTVGSIPSLGVTWSLVDCRALGIAYTAVHQFVYDGVNFNRVPYFDPVGVRTYDFSSVFNHANAFERLNNYHPVDNPAGFDYENKTPAEIRARVLDTLTPKTGGDWDLGAGVTVGAINLDGTLKV